jgi:DNA mismatch repair protein MutS
MRQAALIVLMAQMGSFVPADEAEIDAADRIFTRIGASDDLSGGQSTFMVEMNEMANILNNATKDSLIIVDEVGRGTSTSDGFAIAQAVMEYIADRDKLGAKTFFATHFHELAGLEGIIDGAVNYCFDIKEDGENIVFLRKIIKSRMDRSYGIHVARLAGVPKSVITRAGEIMADLAAVDSSRQIYAKATDGDAPMKIVAYGKKQTKEAEGRLTINLEE